jgi:hypothetical protein
MTKNLEAERAPGTKRVSGPPAPPQGPNYQAQSLAARVCEANRQQQQTNERRHNGRRQNPKRPEQKL